MLRHAFRQVAELFPSFGYGGRLWSVHRQVRVRQPTRSRADGPDSGPTPALRSCKYRWTGERAVCRERAGPSRDTRSTDRRRSLTRLLPVKSLFGGFSQIGGRPVGARELPCGK